MRQAGRARAEVALATSGECRVGIWYELGCGLIAGTLVIAYVAVVVASRS